VLKNSILLIALFLLGAVPILSACESQAGTAPGVLTPEISPKPFWVIGYVTQAVVVETIPFDQLTHINYAFLIPKSDGTFETLPNAWKLEKVVQNAHQHEVRVLISVGGWGWDAEFESMAADPETRAVFVDELFNFVDQYQLDGVDIDWEYPDPGQSAQNFLSLIQELRIAMPEKLITTAVVSRGETGEGILTETFAIFDFVNIMAYDGGEPHSPYALAEESIDYWQDRGLPPEKTVLGLPFYAHPNFTPYRKIVETDPQAAFQDAFEYLGATLDYNGIPTIERKTNLALQRGSGVMIWTIEYDSRDETSLLLAINRVLRDP
jgi:GH18 family chitinase